MAAGASLSKAMTSAPINRSEGRIAGALVAAHIEADQAVLSGYLDQTGVGEPPFDQPHGAQHDRGGVEAGAEEPGDLGEQRQPVAPRLGVAQGFALVFEHLRPFQRLCGQTGQVRQEAQLDLARDDVFHEGQREDAERTDACPMRARSRWSPAQPVRPRLRGPPPRGQPRRWAGSPTPKVVMLVRPRAKEEPARVPSTGTSPRDRRAGCPLLARHERARSPGSGTRHTADCAPRARRPAAMAARATSIGVVAPANSELRSCKRWLRSRLSNSMRVRRARSTAWAAAPVMANRKFRSAEEISRLRSSGPPPRPTARSETTSGHGGQ